MSTHRLTRSVGGVFDFVGMVGVTVQDSMAFLAWIWLRIMDNSVCLDTIIEA